MEDELRVVPDTGDVDGDQVLADLLPLDGAAAAGGDVEHLRPQSATVTQSVLFIILFSC